MRELLCQLLCPSVLASLGVIEDDKLETLYYRLD